MRLAEISKEDWTISCIVEYQGKNLET